MTPSWDGSERRRNNGGLLERIHSLETEVARLADAVDGEIKNRTKYLDDIFKMLRNQDIVIFGDEEKKVIGVKEEIRVLIKKENERQIHLNTITWALIAGFFKMMFDFLTKKIGG